MGARHVHLREIEFHNQNLFLVRAGFGQDFSRRPSDKTLAPELNTIARQLLAANTVRHGYIASIRDGMGALNGLPRGMLLSALGGFFRRVPTNCRRLEKYLRSLHGGKARRF